MLTTPSAPSTQLHAAVIAALDLSRHELAAVEVDGDLVVVRLRPWRDPAHDYGLSLSALERAHGIVRASEVIRTAEVNDVSRIMLRLGYHLRDATSPQNDDEGSALTFVAVPRTREPLCGSP